MNSRLGRLPTFGAVKYAEQTNQTKNAGWLSGPSVGEDTQRGGQNPTLAPPLRRKMLRDPLDIEMRQDLL